MESINLGAYKPCPPDSEWVVGGMPGVSHLGFIADGGVSSVHLVRIFQALLVPNSNDRCITMPMGWYMHS